MNGPLKITPHTLLILALLATPIFACSTLAGDSGDDAVAVVEEELDAVPPVDPGQGQESPPAAPTQVIEQVATVISEVSGLGGDFFDGLNLGPDVSSGRITQTTTDLVTGEEVVTVFEFVRPDRFHVIQSDTEMLVIGDEGYMGSSELGWLPVPAVGQALVGGVVTTVRLFTGEASIEELESRGYAVEQAGTESIDGVVTQVYEISPIDSVTPGDETFTIWIGADDGRPYRWQKHTTIEEANADSLLTFEFAYNLDINIEPPE
jgi:hypothetical protein